MIRLYYLTNFCRREVGTVDSETILQAENMVDALYQQYQKCGYYVTYPEGKLMIKQDDSLIPFDESLISINNDITIVYCSIVKMDNAAEFARENGISYFFHTSEKSHLNYPHIHAKYAEDEISIYLDDFRILGRFRNRKKQREAAEFVKTNFDRIYEEWHRIIES